jgi:hypothetical protein
MMTFVCEFSNILLISVRQKASVSAGGVFGFLAILCSYRRLGKLPDPFREERAEVKAIQFTSAVAGRHVVLYPNAPSKESPAFPARNPVNMPNRCGLKPLTPEMPEETLLLVLPQRRLTLQVVCPSLPRFQLPKPSACARYFLKLRFTLPSGDTIGRQ